LVKNERGLKPKLTEVKKEVLFPLTLALSPVGEG
jgi:hypothetical protein